MSEGYTIGGDASIKIEEDIRCCQTFTPTYTHTIAYIDLDCKLCAFYRRPTILIVTTDEDGKPTDNIITTGRTSWLAKYPTDELVRVRFNLDWATLYEGVKYALVIYFPRPGTGQYLWWQYDTAGATYDGGIRLESVDRGETWTPYPDSDFMFFEFGKEPAPLPSPDPPVGNFAILDLQQEVTATGIKITVTTNVPCHLYCYWTAKEPEKHLIPILTRGIELHTQLKMCFVNWNENEQEEAGDTLFHTFTKEPWAHCETRWLTFRAKVMENWVKSVGPIFKKHRVAPSEPVPSGECYLLTNCAGYGGMPPGADHAWAFIPVETFSTNHLRLWLADYFLGADYFTIIGRIWDRDPAGGPPRNILGEHTIAGQLPFRPTFKQMDFTFPLIELEVGLTYFFGFLHQYRPPIAWLHRSISADHSNCWKYWHYRRYQNPDYSFEPWTYAMEYAQPCHQFFIDP